MMGEKVGAVIVLKPNQQALVPDILQFASQRLANFKVPQYVVIRGDALPRNPGGKILKKHLREGVDWGPPVR
jgi:acyl-CoA synthetase (AMP-forming)/AMP-acid ligase II